MTQSLGTMRFPWQELWVFQALETWFSHFGVYQNDLGSQ